MTDVVLSRSAIADLEAGKPVRQSTFRGLFDDESGLYYVGMDSEAWLVMADGLLKIGLGTSTQKDADNLAAFGEAVAKVFGMVRLDGGENDDT